MIQIDKTDYLYKTLISLGEQDIDAKYIELANEGINSSKDLLNNLQSRLGMDYLGEFDEQVFDEVLDYYKDLKRNKVLSKTKLHSILKEYKQNPSSDLRAEIINSQLKEVLLIACGYKLRHEELSLSDLVQVCNMGLMVAVDKFDVTAKVPFEIYLNYWIIDIINKEYTLGEEKNG